MLVVRDLTVHYQGFCALDRISFNLESGQLVGVVGPNGAGKSTLLKSMLGLVAPQGGSIRYDGHPLIQQRQKVAYVPQRSQIDWNYPITVKNVVMLAQMQQQGFWQFPTRQARQRVKQALIQVDLWDLRDRHIRELSGGQQQRVFLARSLAQQADIFFFDEPFNGVDQKTKEIFYSILQELKEEHKTLLIVSHDLGDTLNYYDQLMLINRSILATGLPQEVLTPDNFYQAYGHPFNLLSA
ncbi:metal ABC transporter ATP-binding protein [Spirulina subsalsa]|uniref:metal ABC transporter ATP-binding protein n=1 Tax=Spirulina subsalsa TaxID=54311 RepID=UPI0002DA08D9|nr:metal ABC transporter ATP-binding protein [Spirulina subsalsa]